MILVDPFLKTKAASMQVVINRNSPIIFFIDNLRKSIPNHYQESVDKRIQLKTKSTRYGTLSPK